MISLLIYTMSADDASMDDKTFGVVIGFNMMTVIWIYITALFGKDTKGVDQALAQEECSDRWYHLYNLNSTSRWWYMQLVNCGVVLFVVGMIIRGILYLVDYISSLSSNS
jgi:hypothetical protein